MKNKYIAYSYLSIKTLILNKSILLGFIFNLILALIVTLYIIIFKPDLPIQEFINGIIYNFSNSLGSLNLIIILFVLLLFGSIATMMQSVIDDRDSKVSEIINTSIYEKHYLFGKIVTSFVLISVTLISAILALTIAGLVFSIFNPYDFSVYTDIIKPVFTSLTGERILLLFGCAFLALLMLITSIMFTLGLSIKANSSVDAFPISLLVLTPYFLLIGLLIFLPNDNIELWANISATIMFIPLFSPIFILLYVILKGFTILSFVAIAVSLIYLLILFLGVSNVFGYAFYVTEKISFKNLLQLSVGRKI